ncbi:MAG TPA: hypothetical protein VND21_09585 [Planctomycetota bacterium]|nr:hypothetical protein [Planctomycetota bacterium]
MATPTRSRSARKERPPVSRRKLLLLAGAAVVTLAGVAFGLKWLLSGERVRHELPVRWPDESPHGEPFRIGHAVKPGDVYVMTIDFASGVILGFDTPDPFTGMRLDGFLRVGHGVTERAGGLTSTVRVVLDRVTATYGPMREAVAGPLQGDGSPYTITFDREADGRPIAGGTSSATAAPLQRQAVDTVTAGLGDLRTNWVPDRPIRLGEAWDITEVADVLPNVLEMLRRAAGTQGPGFPEPEIRGRVGAEAFEDRDGEPCLRLRVGCGARVEGYAKPPAVAVWLTAAARVEGTIWVSRATGIVWGMDLNGDLRSSYLIPDRHQHRNARQRITAKTERMKDMPE